MSVEYDFEKISLLPKERRSLEKLRRKGSLDKSEISNYSLLHSFGLVEHDQSDKQDALGVYVPLPTVHVTDKYLRYHSWRMSQILHSVFLPIAISVLTTLLINLLQGLLRMI